MKRPAGGWTTILLPDVLSFSHLNAGGAWNLKERLVTSLSSVVFSREGDWLAFSFYEEEVCATYGKLDSFLATGISKVR